MRITSKHICILLFCIALGIFLYGCANLGKAKGTIVDVLTDKPISGALIVATTSSDLESEQKHLKYSTVTDSNGHFVIKGLRQKYYSIRVTKNGYTNADFSITSIC